MLLRIYSTMNHYIINSKLSMNIEKSALMNKKYVFYQI